MRHIPRRLCAALLILALTVTPALASQALGWELYQTDTVLGPGVTWSSQILWGDSRSDYRREQYVTYTPGQGSSPVVCYGSALLEKKTLTRMASDLESYGARVLAGANGDYFVMASGTPLGMVSTWGVLRSSSSYHYAVGVRADGSMFVGKPDLTLWADFHGYHLSLAGGYNKDFDAKEGYYLYSSDYGSTTRAKGENVTLILRPVELPEDYVAPQAPEKPAEPAVDPETDPVAEGETDIPAEPTATELWQATMAQWEADMALWEQNLIQTTSAFSTLPAQLTVGGTLNCVVESVVDQSGAVSIPADRLALSVGRQSDSFLVETLASVHPGEVVKLSVTTPDARWEEAESAIGAYAWILQNGAIPDGLEQSANPRTALGIKADGTVILYTIDGRRPGHSVGASVRQVAARLLELGCVDAVLFDGGGSTTFGVTDAIASGFSLQNKPSEGSQRAVTNALFFVTQTPATGTLGSIYISPQSALMLSGARQELSGWAIDTAYHPMGVQVTDVSYTVSDGPGRVEGSTFIAGAERGIATVTAQTSSGASGAARMTVIATPDAIQVSDAATGKAVTSLNLDPGQSIELSAAATWYKLPLLADDSCFTWQVSGELGTVDAAGRLTAGSRAGAGTLSVSAGERTVSIPFTVGGHVTPLEDFEGGECQFRALAGAEVSLSDEQVKYGHQAMEARLSGQSASLETYMGLLAGETDISFWLYAPETVTVEATFLMQDGTTATAPVTLGEPGGWSFAQALIPEGAEALTGMTITSAGSGTVYLDQFSSTNGGLRDETPPAVSLNVQDGAIRATLSDNVDKTFDPALISLTLDGASLPFELSGNTLTAQVELYDALLHRLSLTASDLSGNLTRSSVEIPAATGTLSPFVDVEGHWAAAYADYLYDRGVSNGSPSDQGLLFRPGENITRGDFVTMLCRFMGLDLERYADVTLPFVDQDRIQPWALNAVKAAYDLGVFTGSGEADGLYAHAEQSITRAQAMTLLGRIQPKGYLPSQEVFADQEEIPAWAAEHIALLVGQGVVSGYEGYVRPQDPITRAEVAKLLTTLR